MTKEFLRKLVPLQPNEEWQPFIGSVPMPEGMRLETDEEFRNRIVGEMKDQKETK